MPVIHVQNLVKQYKNGVQALNGLNLSIESGEIFSLLGQNGAGKTTLIHILTTYLRPTHGNVMIFKKDLYQDAAFIRSKIACAAQRTSIDTHLSLTENMMFQSRLYKVPTAEAKQRMNNLIDCFGLARYLKYPVSSYSGGVTRRLDIALNMMSNPKILFLDEPTAGMDIQSRMAMWDMLKISFETKDAAKSAFEQLRQFHPLKSFDLRNNTIITGSENSRKDFIQLNHWLLEQGMCFTGIEIIQPSLDDVFIRLTAETKQEGCI